MSWAAFQPSARTEKLSMPSAIFVTLEAGGSANRRAAGGAAAARRLLWRKRRREKAAGGMRREFRGIAYYGARGTSPSSAILRLAVGDAGGIRSSSSRHAPTPPHRRSAPPRFRSRRHWSAASRWAERGRE